MPYESLRSRLAWDWEFYPIPPHPAPGFTKRIDYVKILNFFKLQFLLRSCARREETTINLLFLIFYIRFILSRCSATVKTHFEHVSVAVSLRESKVQLFSLSWFLFCFVGVPHSISEFFSFFWKISNPLEAKMGHSIQIRILLLNEMEKLEKTLFRLEQGQ